jgi:hypothetical protein
LELWLAKSRLQQRNNALLNDVFYDGGDKMAAAVAAKSINNDNFDSSSGDTSSAHHSHDYDTNLSPTARVTDPERGVHSKVVEEPETGRLHLIYDA